MIETVVRIGEKGQLLIPKIFRDHFGILPGQHAALQETPHGLLVKKIEKNPLLLFEESARKFKKTQKEIEAIEHQYEARLKRTGIRL